MEASTPGTQAGPEQLQSALDSLVGDVSQLQTRVNGDLEALKQQVQAAASGQGEVDFSAFVTQIESIQTTVTSIDTQAAPVVAPGGGGTTATPSGTDTPAPGGDPAAATGGDPAAATGGQGVPAGQPAADAVQGDPNAGTTPAADAPPAGGGENTAPGA